ncbi:MAG: T9SS type A sorting domain-containing protein [Prevotella sp.]|nr:T9SS type A sorting domain-containing protein [Prevotella sp.]
MKKCAKWLVATRVLLLVVALFAASAVKGEDVKWYLISQDIKGETLEIPMADVGSLVAVDDAYDFTVLSKIGSVLVEGVIKVTFEQRNPTGIRPMVKENNSIGQVVKDKLTLIGVTGEIFVFDVKGVQQLKVEATGGETTVNIAHLPAGVYVVKTGKQNFKFIKK